MKTLIIPLLLILSPISILFLFLFKTNNNVTSLKKKVVLGTLFIIIGLITSLYAINISMNGMLEQNIRCMTGVIIFIPFAIITNCIGIPLLIFLKNRT